MNDTTPLASARQRMAQATAERAEKALATMIRDRDPITFTAVAQRAGVSREYLYRHPELCQRIKQARQTAPRQLSSTAGKTEGVVAALRDHIRRQDRAHQDTLRQLAADNADLRRQLETALGVLIATPQSRRHDLSD